MSRSSRPPLLPWSKSTWERWSAMPRMSATPIPRTKFLLLKAPASTLYEERFGGDRNMFTVAMFGGRMMAKGVQVGCAVDCTALDLMAFEVPPDGKPVRYFHNTSEWDDYDMEYHSLAPQVDGEGKAVDASTTVPPQSVVDKFFSICGAHWKSRPNENIALFDSRGGIGAAAFLAALYMCEKMRAPVHVALASVKEAMKPCGLADADLARELQRRYKGRREIKIENIPDWWFAVQDDEEDEDDEAGAEGDEKGDGAKKKRDRDITIVIPPFDQMEGNGAKDDGAGGAARKRPRPGEGTADAAHPPVPGLQPQPPGSQRHERALTVLKQLTGRPCTSGIPTGPEFALPSADSLGIHLTHRGYKVTWRSRGRRGLLLVLAEGVYFLENSADGGGMSVSTVKMRFPHPKDRGQTQHRTLLDGVLVSDREGPHAVPRYYATDILCHMGGTLTSRPFGQRIKYLVDGVIMARKRDAGYDYGKEPVKIRANEYFELGKLGFVLKDVTRGIAHKTEGVMLVPLEGKYYGAEGAPGRDSVLLWESGGEVSEDALLKHVTSLG